MRMEVHPKGGKDGMFPLFWEDCGNTTQEMCVFYYKKGKFYIT